MSDGNRTFCCVFKKFRLITPRQDEDSLIACAI